MMETILTVHPISGAELTYSEESHQSSVTLGLQSIESAENMFYTFAQTLKTELKMKRLHILSLCFRAMIFKE
jgi:hypothetical protein